MKFSIQGRGRGVVVAASAAAVAVGGSCIGIAVAAQQSAPQPSVASAQSPVDTTAVAPPAPATAPATSPRAPRSSPSSISIPAIGVRASFVTLGLEPDGSIQVPADVRHVGWYRLGPTPGQVGPAIVLGHVDSATSGAGVFFRLGALHSGDQVVVTLADGRQVGFTVYAVREYPKDTFPTATVYGNTPDSQLRLITCGGSFDSATGHYESNVVAFARVIAWNR